MQANVLRHSDHHMNGSKVSSLVVFRLSVLPKKALKIQCWTAWKPSTRKMSMTKTLLWVSESYVAKIDIGMMIEMESLTGIAACGQTPFVWGAIHAAKLVNAFTAFLTFNTELRLKIQPDVFMAMDLGPEVLTGSTRLKCGTATKCILNMLSTLAMVRYGKCFENLMVDLNPANEKLKKRSLRIVLMMTRQLANIDENVALEILLKNKYDIRNTVVELRNNFVVRQ